MIEIILITVILAAGVVLRHVHGHQPQAMQRHSVRVRVSWRPQRALAPHRLPPGTREVDAVVLHLHASDLMVLAGAHGGPDPDTGYQFVYQIPQSPVIEYACHAGICMRLSDI